MWKKEQINKEISLKSGKQQHSMDTRDKQTAKCENILGETGVVVFVVAVR